MTDRINFYAEMISKQISKEIEEGVEQVDEKSMGQGLGHSIKKPLGSKDQSGTATHVSADHTISTVGQKDNTTPVKAKPTAPKGEFGPRSDKPDNVSTPPFRGPRSDKPGISKMYKMKEEVEQFEEASKSSPTKKTPTLSSAKIAKMERDERRDASKQAFGNMFGGGNPVGNLRVKKEDVEFSEAELNAIEDILNEGATRNPYLNKKHKEDHSVDKKIETLEPKTHAGVKVTGDAYSHTSELSDGGHIIGKVDGIPYHLAVRDAGYEHKLHSASPLSPAHKKALTRFINSHNYGVDGKL